jgi:aldehyde:ferredoxin oxidoreductase
MSLPFGRIARINLTTGSTEIFESREYYEYLGGRGYASKVIFDEVAKDVDPLSAENKIVFATGCFTGTSLAGSSRMALVSKNVLNNGILYSSGGGDLGPVFKRAGFDALIIEGKSEHPVYLYFHDNEVEIKNADFLWGKTTNVTEDCIREDLNDEKVRIACIGPAGENLVKIACVITDKGHAFAWGGSGAIMGFKNLKAIVAKGTGSVSCKNAKSFNEISSNYNWIVKSSNASDAIRKGGTHGMAGVGGWSGKVPTSVKNLQEEFWDPEKSSKINGDAFKKYSKERTTCYNCSLTCLNWYEMEKNGETLSGEGMHANSVRGFGSNWDVDDPFSVLKAHLLCNELGLDVDGVSASIAFAIECFEKGIIDKKDTSGLKLNWGNAEAFLELIVNIANRKDFGDILAEGTLSASKVFGKESYPFAMQVKGIGINEQGVHSHKAWSFAIAVSSRGGGHLSGAPQTENRQTSENISKWLFGVSTYGNPVSYDKKGELVAWYEIYKAIVDSVGICYFDAGWYEVALSDTWHFVELFKALTGDNISKEKFWDIGIKIVNFEKAFNTVHAGFSRSDDILPERVMEIPLSVGPYKGEFMDPAQFQIMLDEYYTKHGWNTETGMQEISHLEKLGTDDIIEYLRENGIFKN